MLLTIIKTLLLTASFMGHCAFVTDRLEIEDTSAPLVVSGGVILVLMASGFMNVLKWGWLALLVLGIGLLIYECVFKRKRPSLIVIGLMLAAVVYCVLHYRGTYYNTHDSVSHWAVAAKYLLRENRFPDAGADMIYFTSYPLGAASFIYYICRVIGMEPGCFMSAQTLFAWFSLMPVFGLVRKKSAAGYALAAVTMIYLMGIGMYRFSLQVDNLMAQMAIGASCVIWLNRERPRRMVAAALPIAVALVYIKSASIFFSVVLVLLMTIAVKRNSRHRKTWLRVLCVALMMVIAAFAIWQLHYKLTFGAFTGKHSVSIDHYSENISEKTTEIIYGIGRNMLLRLLNKGPHVLCLVAYAATLALAVLLGKPRFEWIKRWRQAVLLTAVILVLWYVMLYLMYLFSMPMGEAESLASIYRYEYTSIIYTMGVMLMFAIACVSESTVDYGRVGHGALVCAALATAFVALRIPILGTSPAANLFSSWDGRWRYEYLLNMREKHDIEEGKRYLYFLEYDPEDRLSHAVVTKYELFSNDLLGIYHGEKLIEDGGETEYGYRLNLEFSDRELGYFEDVSAFLAEHMDEYDYLLVYDYDPDFDAALNDFLESYEGNTQVCKNY